MLDSKLVLPYTDDEGNIRGETVLATKEGSYYRIKSIPVRASKIAMYDLIAVQKREGILYFHKIIEGSGRNVIQMIIFNDRQVKVVAKDIEAFGCTWQHSDNKNLIA